MEQLRRGKSRVFSGLLFLAIGCTFLLQRMGFPFPYWLFTWPMILIVIGLFDGIKNNFRGPVWALLLLVGGIFLFDIIEPAYSLKRFTWPLIIIALGLIVIFRPKRTRNRYYAPMQDDQLPYEPAPEKSAYIEPVQHSGPGNSGSEEYLDAVAIFGGTRRVVVSKNFKGGDLVSLFGGHEIDLRQADIHGKVILEVTQIFGGTKLILPSGWHIKSEMVALMGGIEDKRQMPSVIINPEKILVLKGTTIFGGIDIRNH